MGGKGSGRKPGFKGCNVPDSKNPVKQAADPSNVDQEVNSAVMAFGKDIMAFEPPDFGDAKSIEDAFYRYLDLCSKHGIRPMVTSMANAFGIRRQELQRLAVDDQRAASWRGGILTPESRCVIQKSYQFLNTAWETYLMTEKGNPVKWLFLGKNYFAMKDQTEQVQVKMDLTPQLPKAEDVAEKYAAMLGQAQSTLPEAEIIEVEDA